eukprot:jgi/Tetstr1/466738/TSEL_011211.t1
MGMEKYTRGKVLGKGSFGKASVVVNKVDGSTHVLKEIDISKMSKHERDSSLQEAKLLKALRHPNIVSCTETFVDDKGMLCIIMDHCSEGDLYQALQRRKGVLLPEETILDWTVQMCLGLKHVHDRKILHRDLKSQNVFMSKGGVLKLGDFGVSKVLNSTHHLASTAVGTPYYLSPEICQNKKYNQKSDIWSLGCLLYEVTSLKHAFEAGSLKLLIHKIIRGQYPPLSSRYSTELRSLIDNMITRDPKKRPSINQILAEPIIKNRIQQFLSATLRAEEFSHTIIHQRPKPGQLVPGQPAPNALPPPKFGTGASSQAPAARPAPRPGLPSQAPAGGRPGLPSQAPAGGRGNPVVVGSSASRRPLPAAAAPSSDHRRIQEAARLADERVKSEKVRAEEEKAQRREMERKRLELERKRLEAEMRMADEKKREEQDRARRAAEAEMRRQAEADRLKARAEQEQQLKERQVRMRERQEEERRRKLAEAKAEREHREAQRQAERDRQEAAKREFLQRQREAMRNRERAEDDVDVVRLPGGPPRQPRPQWQDVTVPDVNEAAAPPEPRGYANIHARPVSAARHHVSDEERRRVWEENQAAARRNRAQLDGNAPRQPRPQHRALRAEDVPPEYANLPRSERRLRMQEEEAQRRAAEIREFQQRNWAEMKAAAERNKRQLMAKVMEGDGGADAGGEPAQEEDDVTVDDQDVADQAAMYEDMARIYRGGEGEERAEGDDDYDDDDYEDDDEDSNGVDEKEELRQSLSRFMLNGVEIDLGVDAADSLPARVEALRIFLEEQLGFEAFVKVYQLMENVSQEDDENAIMEEIFGTLGVEKMPYLQLIHQLIICEESMHTGRV